ncbi:hypothetical protein EsDP_00002538 [Epichloe bromicola]|uniref:Uncharacterized protein n=1 Tax=Epichloe bromicola TaxID=79588 RepID=A0ABQ0CL63_9HYPO
MTLIAFLRRKLVIAVCLSLVLMGLLHPAIPFDMGLSEVMTHIQKSEKVANVDFLAESPNITNHASPSDDPVIPVSNVRTSRLHLLIPASRPNLQFCYHLASATANRYPAPTLLGWNGHGELDAAVTHLAKLRAMKRYLDRLNLEEEGDDLVMIVDGYDIIHQLPPDVIIERYFEAAAKANAHLAQRLGLSVKHAGANNLKQTVFFGPDKVCWPHDARAARCWAAPPSTLGVDPFGPDKGPDEYSSKDPRWLNSGTIIGPVTDVTKVINTTIEEIDATYDAEFWQSDSDQYYLSNVWGRQEYWRNQTFLGEDDPDDDSLDRIIPEKSSDTQETELHIAIEYESSLFQTKFGNEPFIGFLQYNLTDQSANINIDPVGQGENFRPYPIRMPDNVRTALMKLYNAVPSAHPGVSAEDWIQLVLLGTNFVTKQIYGLWHCTGSKEFLDGEYTKMWFYPFVKALLRESVKTSQRNEPLSTKLIDGRRWIPKRSYPNKEETSDEYGGAWSDEGPGKFVSWKEMCGEHEGILFAGSAGYGFVNGDGGEKKD